MMKTMNAPKYYGRLRYDVNFCYLYFMLRFVYLIEIRQYNKIRTLLRVTKIHYTLSHN